LELNALLYINIIFPKLVRSLFITFVHYKFKNGKIHIFDILCHLSMLGYSIKEKPVGTPGVILLVPGFCGYYYYYSSTDCLLWVHDSCTRKEHCLKEQMLLWAVVVVPYIRTYHKNILFLPYIFVQTVHVWHQPFIYNFQNNLTSKTYNLNRKAVRSNLIQNKFWNIVF
jgi:hypothetical protein